MYITGAESRYKSAYRRGGTRKTQRSNAESVVVGGFSRADDRSQVAGNLRMMRRTESARALTLAGSLKPPAGDEFKTDLSERAADHGTLGVRHAGEPTRSLECPPEGEAGAIGKSDSTRLQPRVTHQNTFATSVNDDVEDIR
jgi:hypothetical protein